MTHSPSLRAVPATLLTLASVAAFQAAFQIPALGWLVLGYLGSLWELRRLATPRQAFYTGTAIGLGVYVPQMFFLWSIFRGAALPLWAILALFHGAFLLMLNRVDARWGGRAAAWLMPVLWCGLEHLRSEVWWLRFAWFTAGSCWPVALEPKAPHRLGVYGLGFALSWVAAQGLGWLRETDPGRRRRAALGLVAGGAVLLGAAVWPPHRGYGAQDRRLPVAGIQFEFPALPELLQGLDGLIQAHPEAELLMVSEYTLEGPPTQALKNWCRKNRKWLVVGGKQAIESTTPAATAGETTRGTGGAETAPAPSLLSTPALPWQRSGPPKERFHNTAFVIGTNGQVVFQQAKSRPIQFFDDGEPAPSQAVWESPWGRLGIAICYDASYRQVMDALIRQGAVGLLIPTMDVEHWGAHEHGLNARMAVLRAAEYGVPIFRVASSGISQLIDQDGRESATAPFPGQGETLAGTLELRSSEGSIPPDAWLAPACMVATGVVLLGLGIGAWRDRREKQHRHGNPTGAGASDRLTGPAGSPQAGGCGGDTFTES